MGARIILDKNYNNKVGCDFMVHIMRHGKDMNNKTNREQVVTFKVGDLEVNYKLADYAKDALCRIPEHLWRASFGNITQVRFFEIMQEKHRLHHEDYAGIYFFERVG